MLYLFISVILLLFIVIILLIHNYRASKAVFEKKIILLEEMISELRIKLKNKNDSVAISEVLKHNLSISNKILSEKILEMNYVMLDDLYNKRNDLT